MYIDKTIDTFETEDSLFSTARKSPNISEYKRKQHVSKFAQEHIEAKKKKQFT